MAISKPAGRIGSAPDAPPGREHRDRSNSSIPSGVRAGFGLNSGSLDELPVRPARSVLEGTAGVPDVKGTPAIGDVNTESRSR